MSLLTDPEDEQHCPTCGEYYDIEVVFGVTKATCGCPKINLDEDEKPRSFQKNAWPPKVGEIVEEK
jgi:hypothetical protein